jgi:hypothetical protein
MTTLDQQPTTAKATRAARFGAFGAFGTARPSSHPGPVQRMVNMRMTPQAAPAPARHWAICLALLAALLLAPLGAARAADEVFSEAELDQMLAPIALYPDSLLSQVLMASTYPLDVQEAAAWSKAHPDAKGDAAVEMVTSMAWEPSVQSLVAFPQLLAMMDAQPDQVQRLGDAFLADPARVMDRVQYLRQKAKDSGHLESSEQQSVSVTTDNSKQVVVIEPAQPEKVYVPVYQPTVVYGSWWYPAYPPYYWPPPPRYYPGGAFVAGVIWGAAIVGIHNSLWGGFGWGHGHVDININRYNNIHINRKIDINHKTFVHNPDRRGHVPYRDSKSRETFGKQQLAGARDREGFRGKDSREAQREQARQTLQARNADPAAGREKLQGVDRDKVMREIDRNKAAQGIDRDKAAQAIERSKGAQGIDRENAAQAIDRSKAAQGIDRDKASQAARNIQRGPSPSSANGNAFSGVRNTRGTRADAARGQASRASMARRAPRGGGLRGR